MTRNDDLEAVGLLYDAALGHADWSDAGARLASLVDGMDRVAPHISRALQIRSRFQQASLAAELAAAALDNLSFGIIQVTATGRMESANQAGLAILGSDDGLSLERVGLRARFAPDDSRLQAAIKEAARQTAGARGSGGGSGYLRIRRPSGARSYSVIVAPLGFARPLATSNSPVAMLMVTDPEAGAPLDIRALRTLFGFTPAEARLVNLLVGGRSLPDIARELGISFETARTHLARARAKTETASQVDLVRTVLLALSPLRTIAP